VWYQRLHNQEHFALKQSSKNRKKSIESVEHWKIKSKKCFEIQILAQNFETYIAFHA
jgi:hypothetical protein